ncbi:MAG: hypothetical protein ACLQVX_16060 [Limisphaerales bacterium]
MCRFFTSVLFVMGFVCGALGERPAALEIPFEFRDGLIWLEVRTPQSRQPLQFILDSGAEVSTLNLSTAKRLHLPLGTPVLVEGVDTVSKGFWPQFLAVGIDGIELPGEYLVVDLSRVSRSCRRAVDGLVGADFFSRRVVRIDFAARRIQVLEEARPSRTSEIVRLESRGGGMRVPVSVNGGAEQWMRLDTGCATALEWVTSAVGSGQGSTQIAVALKGPSIPMIHAGVRFGKNDFPSVPTGLHPHEIFPGESGLIGNGVLGRFASVTIDVAAGRLILDPPLSAVALQFKGSVR